MKRENSERRCQNLHGFYQIGACAELHPSLYTALTGGIGVVI